MVDKVIRETFPCPRLIELDGTEPVGTVIFSRDDLTRHIIVAPNRGGYIVVKRVSSELQWTERFSWYVKIG